MYKKLLFLFIICSGLFITLAESQERIEIPRINSELNFDGNPNEAFWADLKPFEFIMHTPVFGNKPSENTDVRICFDDNYLYVGAKLFYENIEEIITVGKQRDYASTKSDWICIVLDSFNDKENCICFFTNPESTRTDAAGKNDMNEGFVDLNFSWNTFWDVKTHISDDGWYAEFRIPLSSLRFQSENGEVIMGLILWRFLAKKNELILHPAIPPNWPLAYLKPSQAREIIFKGLESKKPVYITPYLLGGFGQSHELNTGETDYLTKTYPTYEAGLDVKFGLSNNLTMDITVNTDFAQVEADDQKINLTRYSLFFPEKRIFFQEKADVFDFPLMGGNNLFYSRRIGLHEGQAVRIYGGVRMTGRVNEWDIGVLDMQTASIDDLPSENFCVLRTKKRILNKNSYVGSMLTSRLGTDGSFNIAYGLDSRLRLIKDEYLTLKWAQTFENDIPNNPISMSPSRLLVRWERRNLKGFSYDFLYTWSGQEFNPGIGFELVDNYFAERAIFQYGWFPDESSRIRYHNISQTSLVLNSSIDGSLETILSITSWSIERKDGYNANFAFNLTLEDLGDTLYFATDVYIPPLKYNSWFLKAQMGTPGGNDLSTDITASAGTFFDGYKLSATIKPAWSISPGFLLNGSYQVDWLNFQERDQDLLNHIFSLKGLVMTSTKISFSALIQYNTAINGIITNFRFRYNPKEGSDLYLVYNEGLNTYLDREIPTLPRSDNRSFLVKYTYTFGF